MAYQGMPAGCVLAGVGLGFTLAESQQQLKRAERLLAEQRRITEGELIQKTAEIDAQALQEKVISWLPKVAIGVALLVGGVIVYRKVRRKNPRRRARGRRR